MSGATVLVHGSTVDAISVRYEVTGGDVICANTSGGDGNELDSGCQ